MYKNGDKNDVPNVSKVCEKKCAKDFQGCEKPVCAKGIEVVWKTCTKQENP